MFKEVTITVYYILFLYFSFYIGFILEKNKVIFNWYIENVWWVWPTTIIVFMVWLMLMFLPVILNSKFDLD